MRVAFSDTPGDSSTVDGHAWMIGLCFHLTQEESDRWSNAPRAIWEGKPDESINAREWFLWLLDAWPEAERARLLQESLLRTMEGGAS